ncbi:hypothetical protein FACS189456_2960 [Bacteroidia bacterium]|nr:hypothetical protein FACS189456_2960 [Bacteroidia bacterium]
MKTNSTPKQKRREPQAWLYENGEKKPFVYEKTTDKLSAIGIWRRDHPSSGVLTKAEMRAALK